MQHSRGRLKIADRNSEQYLHNDVPADEVGDQYFGNCRCKVCPIRDINLDQSRIMCLATLKDTSSHSLLLRLKIARLPVRRQWLVNIKVLTLINQIVNLFAQHEKCTCICLGDVSAENIATAPAKKKKIHTVVFSCSNSGTTHLSQEDSA